MREVVDAAVGCLGRGLDKDGIRLELDLPDIEVSMSPKSLEQVLVNLIRNAFEAMQAAETAQPAVDINVIENADLLEIQVVDNGPGIDPSRRETIFEPYETSRAKGTGLGLAIVKKIILDHGGEIWVEDSDLGGARFVVSLPA